jgi:hypothetical protein
MGYRWPVNVNRVVVDTRSAWSFGIIDAINGWRPVGITLYIFAARPCIISLVIVNVNVGNIIGLVDIVYHPCTRYIVIVNTWAVNISCCCKYPVSFGYVIAAAK